MDQTNLKTNLVDHLPIFKYGSSILRKKARTIKDFTIIPKMVEKMFAAMKAEHGIGLAANQVGWNLNLLVVDTRNYDEEEGKQYIFLNAEIIHSEGEAIMEEGCLSIPGIRAQIKRPETIQLKYQDIEQKFHQRYFSGFISRVIQHEIDHLNGKLFIDYLSQTKRTLINKRLLEISNTEKQPSAIIL